MNFKKKQFILIFLILLAQCAGSHNPRPDISKSVIKPNFLPIGHRGTRDFAPENTMAAFRFAASQGAAFELDTMFCKSGELVVIHDYTVDRTTNGKGKVSDLTLTELKALDSGSYFIPLFKEKLASMTLEDIRNSAKKGFIFSKKFRGKVEKMSKEEILALEDSNFLVDTYKNEKIPTLSEVIDEFKGKVIIDIEIKSEKSGPPAIELGKAVAQLITDKKAESGVFVTSFNPFVLESVKKTNPNIVRGQLYSHFKDANLSYFTKVLLRNLYFNDKAEPDILAMDRELVNSEYVQEMKSHKYLLTPWTVNDPKEIEDFIDYGVDGIISDRVDRVIEIHAKKKKP